MTKIRIDQLLMQNGLCESRSKARALLMAGNVLVGDCPITKAGTQVQKDSLVRLKGKVMPFVSRGGLKLNHALNFFNINPSNWVCFDAGASTGGFTDCLLQRGAALVYSVDVGSNQLHWKLCSDPRVVSLERINIRYWNASWIPNSCRLLVADFSFISLRLVIPPLIASLAPNAEAILLIKPQFEAGRSEVGSGGIVRDPDVHQRVQREIWNFFENTMLKPIAVCESPILGMEGNKEFLMYLRLDKVVT
jgi:23S rRNA (cytidine1920-2'-O)/16S rRNA (cytidine1409-2'-O)-methyltransferase